MSDAKNGRIGQDADDRAAERAADAPAAEESGSEGVFAASASGEVGGPAATDEGTVGDAVTEQQDDRAADAGHGDAFPDAVSGEPLEADDADTAGTSFLSEQEEPASAEGSETAGQPDAEPAGAAGGDAGAEAGVAAGAGATAASAAAGSSDAGASDPTDTGDASPRQDAAGAEAATTEGSADVSRADHDAWDAAFSSAGGSLDDIAKESPSDEDPAASAAASILAAEEARAAVGEPATVAEEPAPTADAGDAAADPWFEPAQTRTFNADDAPPAEESTAEPATAATTANAAPAATTALPPAAEPLLTATPEEPRPRGNRGAAGLIGVVAAIVFAVLYLGAWLVQGLLTGRIDTADLASSTVELVTSFAFWVPVVVFFLAFWLFGVFVNRARWGVWVVLGFLVGVAAYGGHLIGLLVQHESWLLTGSEIRELVLGELFMPVALAAFVIGREATVWFGAWAARRGRKMREQHVEAVAEYERELGAGSTTE